VPAGDGRPPDDGAREAAGAAAPAGAESDAGAVAGARASGDEDLQGGALTAGSERAAEPSGPLTRFGRANIAGIDVMVPVLGLLVAGVLGLAAGLAVALRRRGALGGA